MGVRIETDHGVYVTISESKARSILEQLMSLGEGLSVMDDDEVVDAVDHIVADLRRGTR